MANLSNSACQQDTPSGQYFSLSDQQTIEDSLRSEARKAAKRAATELNVTHHAPYTKQIEHKDIHG